MFRSNCDLADLGVSPLSSMLLIVFVGLILTSCATSNKSDEIAFDWRQTWELKESFNISIDTTGYSLPSAIAFVPNPGNDPKDPLYFVTELRGTVKVVMNDRSVEEFAEVPAFIPEGELPKVEGESGLAGICLDPRRGYVFVTFTELDSDGLLRNNIIRFESEPERFSLSPVDAVIMGQALSREQSALSHQIGGCQVAENSLFVSIGDGGSPSASQLVDRLLGKVVHLTLDGDPFPENPFYNADSLGLGDAARYVWAYGLRNPFGLRLVEGQLYTAENGPEIDRFVRLVEGRNYLWDGTDQSIGTLADVVFSPSVGPAQLDYLPPQAMLFPERYRSSFYIAASAAGRNKAGVIAVPYDLGDRRVRDVPFYLVRQRSVDLSLGMGEFAGAGVVALAIGPDGLYFAQLLPDRTGSTHIFKVTHDAAARYPFIIGHGGNLIDVKGCRSCHMLEGEGGQIGPTLDFEGVRIKALEQRLSSDSYGAKLAELDGLNEEPFISTRQARKEVLEAEGFEKVRTYIRNKLLEPKFDNPNAQMPNLSLTEEEASIIADSLLSVESGPRRLARRIRSVFPFPDTRIGDVLAGIVVGFIGGFWFTFVTFVVWRLLVRSMWRRMRGSD